MAQRREPRLLSSIRWTLRSHACDCATPSRQPTILTLSVGGSDRCIAIAGPVVNTAAAATVARAGAARKRRPAVVRCEFQVLEGLAGHLSSDPWPHGRVTVEARALVERDTLGRARATRRALID